MRRFSILTLMGVVLAVALACFVLRGGPPGLPTAGSPSDLLLTATGLLVVVALVGGLFGGGDPRAGRLGFAALGGGYLALALVVLPQADLDRLPTSRLLHYVHRLAAPTRTVTALVAYNVPARTGPTASFLFPEPPGPRVARVTKTVPNASSAVWGTLLPGAVDSKSFGVAGHCTFALAAGWLGAVVSRRIWGRPASRPSPPLGMEEPGPVVEGPAVPRAGSRSAP